MALFGLTGDDVRSVNFDTDLSGNPLNDGTPITDQFSSIGLTVHSVPVDASVYGGPASAPNTTFLNTPQVYSFNVPVVAAGIINTSPDQDEIEFWSGPNRTGTLLLRFRDQFPGTKNFNIDRFVGLRACEGEHIGSIAMYNLGGDLELDELIFEVEE